MTQFCHSKWKTGHYYSYAFSQCRFQSTLYLDAKCPVNVLKFFLFPLGGGVLIPAFPLDFEGCQVWMARFPGSLLMVHLSGLLSLPKWSCRSSISDDPLTLVDSCFWTLISNFSSAAVGRFGTIWFRSGCAISQIKVRWTLQYSFE